VSGDVAVGISASDNVGVSAVTLIVDGVDVETDSASPFTLTWRSGTATDGSHTLRVRAVDAAGNSTTSNAVTVTVANPSLGNGDIVLYAADATTLVGNFIRQDDPSAAGGRVIRNPDTGAAKRTVALAAPADYFEMTFTAQPNTPYRLWMRGKADGDVYYNDSVFVQFEGATSYAIGTTSFTEYNLEDCSGCRVSGWGWQDNGWGVGVLGPTITFTTAGPHRIRIQPREDGLSIDQIMLSPQRFLSAAPGALRNDTTIYPRSAGGETPPPPGDTQPPTASISAPAPGAVVAGNVVVSASAADDVGVVRVDFLVDGVNRGFDTTAPYGLTWDSTTVPNGAHTLQARAVDAAGNVGASATVGITVSNPTQPPPNVVPTVTLTGPAAGATFTAPATIALTATASDSDGTVARVEFYSGSTLVGSDVSAPYGATWTNVAAGTYALTARAIDNAGGMGTSATVTVTVNAPAPSLPAPWNSQDVGSVSVAGSATASGGVFTVRGEGVDIWNAADEFHFVWQRVSGDVDVVSRVVSIENVHAWVKAGVMFRESLAANSAHALMLVSPGKGYAFQRRLATGGLSTSTSGGSGTAPGWVKLTRRGNVVTAYRSGDGATWVQVGSDTFTMPSDVYVGLVVSSHVDGRLATATFDNVGVVTPGGGGGEPDPEPPTNTPPTVSLTSPTAGATLMAPANINLAATAADSDGTVARVEFYAGNTLLATTTSSPHQAVWSDVPAGTYSLTARAFDNAGASATSAAVTVTVNPPAPAGLPSPWSSQDVGAVGIAGSATASGGTFTVRASGADVWGTADAMHYMSQPVSGDFDIVARVASVELIHQSTKAGVMVRDALTANAANGFMLVTPGKGLDFQRRAAAGRRSTTTSGGAGSAPVWVKLERRGDRLTAYRSANGVAWTLVGSDTVSFGATVRVGLGLTSHDNSRLATATFDNVSLTPR
jgi:regulation of enolase protein 1 (concanavalin A-like superfamily)